MVTNIEIDALRKLPHVNCEDAQNRIFPLHPLLDENGKWHLWVPQNDKIIDMTGIPVESNYFAKAPDRSDDIIIPFLEFLEKRALWRDVWTWTTAITNDIHNLAASMAKLDLLFEASKSKGPDIKRMVSTELEYIFLTCRSVFDLLQKTIANLWKKIKILSPPTLKKKELPESFAKVVLHGDIILSPVEIATKYQIPNEFADFYHRNAQFFQWLRDYRISISHRTEEIDFVFATEKGLAILHDKSPFKEMPIWSSTNTMPNNLGSVKSAASYIISYTLKALDDAIVFFQTTIQFPADVVPNYRMYTRGVHNNHLVNLNKNILNPW